MNRGWFITFEGPDGSGKSTQIHLLAEALALGDVPFVQTREPGGTPIGEKIRSIILDPAHREMVPLTEVLLYAASRAQHTEQLIRPALAVGQTVLCDRYMDSSLAYQGYGRKLGPSVRLINEIAVSGLAPDRTFLLALDPAIGLGRICREPDRLEAETLAWHQTVYRGYLELAELYPERIVVLDATRPAAIIHREVLDELARLDERFEQLKRGGG